MEHQSPVLRSLLYVWTQCFRLQLIFIDSTCVFLYVMVWVGSPFRPGSDYSSTHPFFKISRLIFKLSNFLCLAGSYPHLAHLPCHGSSQIYALLVPHPFFCLQEIHYFSVSNLTHLDFLELACCVFKISKQALATSHFYIIQMSVGRPEAAVFVLSSDSVVHVLPPHAAFYNCFRLRRISWMVFHLIPKLTRVLLL